MVNMVHIYKGKMQLNYSSFFNIQLFRAKLSKFLFFFSIKSFEDFNWPMIFRILWSINTDKLIAMDTNSSKVCMDYFHVLPGILQ